MVEAQQASSSRNDKILLALLTIINVLNFVDRQLLSSFANFIKPDLGLTDTQFGLLTGLVFILFYAVAGLFMGMLADHFNRPKLIAAAIAVWSLLTAASGAAKGFVSMALPRALIGIGESALTPAAVSLLADRVPPEKLGAAIGIYFMGVPIGAGASLIIAGWLGPMIGWRNCFYALGILGLVLSVAMLLVAEKRPAAAKGSKGPDFAEQFKLLGGAIRQSPALWLTVAGNVAIHMAVGAAVFDQLWLVQERGYDKAEIATTAGILTLAGGVAGNLFGGYVGDWWHKNMSSGRPMMLFWMMVLLGPFACLYRTVGPESPFLLIGIAVGVFQLASTYGPMIATIQALSPPKARATVTAFHILCANAIGLGIGITATGVMIDKFRAAGFDHPYSAAMLVMTFLSMLCIPAFYLAGRWFDRDLARMETDA